MDEIRLALLLTVVVICVLAATRPETQRHRRPSASMRGGTPRASSSPKPPQAHELSRISLSRNRWDRIDLARAIGRDVADAESTLSWPGGTLTPRI